MSRQQHLFDRGPSVVTPQPLATTPEFNADLAQYMTPAWAADCLVGQFFADIDARTRVVEPSCGEGAFLAALPVSENVVGVEIDPALAQRARDYTGQHVITGDFLDTELPFRPDVVVGNPPFQAVMVAAFLARARQLLPSHGRVGFILPAHHLQTSSTVASYAVHWGLEVQMIPRDMFACGIKTPLVFAMFHRDRPGTLVGLALYHERESIKQLERRYRRLLERMGRGSVWERAVCAVLEDLGGTASLRALYEMFEKRPGLRPSARNRHWKAKVRQIVQRCPLIERRGPAQYALAAA